MITYANGLKRVETIDELQKVITPKAFAHAFDGKFSYPHWCNKYHTNGYFHIDKENRTLIWKIQGCYWLCKESAEFGLSWIRISKDKLKNE